MLLQALKNLKGQVKVSVQLTPHERANKAHAYRLFHKKRALIRDQGDIM
jgi:hypothetical protein